MENMNRVCQELDEAKIEIEKLKAGCTSKAEQNENLKRVCSEHLSKLQEASSRLERNERELNEREGEISMLKQMCEEVKHNLDEKDLIVKRLNAANDKLRADFSTRSQKLEEENRSLALAIEEANLKCEDQEGKIKTLKEENDNLTGLLDLSRKKNSEAEQRANAPKELRDRDSVICNLEEEVRKLEDGLKWKNEQFKHLEEAHVKLRDRYQNEKKEWESEKSTLLNQILSLQESLDSQIRVSEDLKKKLEMCNGALAHEEGRRKSLEVQLSEFKEFNILHMEGDEMMLQLHKRDEEVAFLRHSLGMRETDYKEVQLRASQLETENRELLSMLKELREEQINGGENSLAKLRKRLSTVEQMHRDCSSNLRTKEVEWSAKVEKLMADLEECRSELDYKENKLDMVNKELGTLESLLMELMVQNEESYMMLLVLKLGISEAQIKMQGQVTEERASILVKLLETKNENMADAQRAIIQEHEKMRVQLKRNKEILDEAVLMESSAEERIREAYDALDRANAELGDRIRETNETEFELQIWKSIAERLNVGLEESQCLRKEMEASILAQAEVEDAMKREKANLTLMLEEKDRRIDWLEQKIVLVEREMKERESEENFSDIILEDVMKEALGRELESTLAVQMSAENAFELERKELVELIQTKNQRIKDLLHVMSSLEQKFDNSSISFSTLLAEKQAEINLFHEAWDRMAAAEILAELEIEEKKLMVIELENEVHALISKLESQGESLQVLKQNADRVEAALDAKESEMKKLTHEAEMRLQSSCELIDELKREKIHLLGERDCLLGLVRRIEETIGECCEEDMTLMDSLRNCLKDNEPPEMLKENSNGHYFGALKRHEITSNGRSPFRELNRVSLSGQICDGL
ncbi:hypothetical protein SAY87_021995 [Trapa incisa]|uniref:Uncharacterized protein n=1 Tax=Trapa incisa TaxID=236973 RepID=A0AAN7PRP4_9MYRT|nr:hypothetical protein SAY87_021995 [Trapa incisa]